MVTDWLFGQMLGEATRRGAASDGEEDRIGEVRPRWARSGWPKGRSALKKRILRRIPVLATHPEWGLPMPNFMTEVGRVV
jgi:hypothetical protein